MGTKRRARSTASARPSRRRIDPRLEQALSRMEPGATIDAVIMFKDPGKKAASRWRSCSRCRT